MAVVLLVVVLLLLVGAVFTSKAQRPPREWLFSPLCEFQRITSTMINSTTTRVRL
jgi:hypothetical protein